MEVTAGEWHRRIHVASGWTDDRRAIASIAEVLHEMVDHFLPADPSPAPPVTPAAEEWAEGDLAWVTWNGETVLRWHANYGNSPRWWRIDRWNTGLPHDSPGIKSIVRAVVCPPGLTPVDLDELAEKVKALRLGEVYEASGIWCFGLARDQALDLVASYRRSGSAER